MPEKNFSKITLRLSDKKYASSFWEFAVEEIMDAVPYFTITGLCLYLA